MQTAHDYFPFLSIYREKFFAFCHFSQWIEERMEVGGEIAKVPDSYNGTCTTKHQKYYNSLHSSTGFAAVPEPICQGSSKTQNSKIQIISVSTVV